MFNLQTVIYVKMVLVVVGSECYQNLYWWYIYKILGHLWYVHCMIPWTITPMFYQKKQQQIFKNVKKRKRKKKGIIFSVWIIHELLADPWHRVAHSSSALCGGVFSLHTVSGGWYRVPINLFKFNSKSMSPPYIEAISQCTKLKREKKKKKNRMTYDSQIPL